jgi:hypothetical protein
MLLLFDDAKTNSVVPHPLLPLFSGRDGFLYDGTFSSGLVDYGLDDLGADPCDSSGDVCLFVRDHSGNGRNLIQTTSAAGLIYRIDGNGKQSFITGNTTPGGTGRFGVVDGIGALPQAYTDIIVFKSLDIAGNNGLTNTYESFSYTPSPFSDYRHLSVLRVGGTGRYGYAYNHGTQSQDITFGTDIAALGEVGWTTHRIGGGIEAAYSGIMPNWDTNNAAMLTSGFGVSTSGPSGVLDDGTRTQLGLNDPADVSNLEYVFRMRVYAALTAGELETVTAYLNSTSIYAWTGGTP